MIPGEAPIDAFLDPMNAKASHIAKCLAQDSNILPPLVTVHFAIAVGSKASRLGTKGLGDSPEPQFSRCLAEAEMVCTGFTGVPPIPWL